MYPVITTKLLIKKLKPKRLDHLLMKLRDKKQKAWVKAKLKSEALFSLRLALEKEK